MGLGLCGLSSPPCPCGRIINGTRKRRARRASSSAGRADRSQAMPAERIKSWGGEGQNSDKPAEPWQFLEASGSHFAVKAGHHGGHFVRSNGRAGSHLVLAEGRKTNTARGGGWLCPGCHQSFSSTGAKHCK